MSKETASRENLYEYLDWYDFVNRSEISDAVLEYFAEELDILNPSYWHCLAAGQYADEYIEDRGIKFDDNDDIVK